MTVTGVAVAMFRVAVMSILKGLGLSEIGKKRPNSPLVEDDINNEIPPVRVEARACRAGRVCLKGLSTLLKVGGSVRWTGLTAR